jgi:kynurenine formamidase
MCAPETFAAVHDHHDHALSRRQFFRAGAAVGAGVALAASLPAPVLAAPAGARRFLDLTHVLRDGFPTYPAAGANPRRVPVASAKTPAGYSANQWILAEHSGTHLDAPAHFSAGGRTVADIPLEELVMPAVVIDISARSASDPDTTVTVADLRDFEAAMGRIPQGGAVLVYSGWEARIGDEARFRNLGADGRMHYPGWGPEATEWLLTSRDVRCIGIDTFGLDPGNSLEFPVHKMWLPEDKLGVEVLANLGALPPTGSTLVIGAIPFEDGSAAPGRIFAMT